MGKLAVCASWSKHVQVVASQVILRHEQPEVSAADHVQTPFLPPSIANLWLLMEEHWTQGVSADTSASQAGAAANMPATHTASFLLSLRHCSHLENRFGQNGEPPG